MHGVICAGVILSVMGAAFFFYVLCAPHPWPVCLVCAGTDWLVPKSPVAFHTLGLGLLPVCITPSTSASNSLSALPLLRWLWVSRCGPNGWHPSFSCLPIFLAWAHKGKKGDLGHIVGYLLCVSHHLPRSRCRCEPVLSDGLLWGVDVHDARFLGEQTRCGLGA